MTPPTNPVLYPITGPLLGFQRQHPRRSALTLHQAEELYDREGRGMMNRYLQEAGYAGLTRAAWASAVSTETREDPILDSHVMAWRFPRALRPGVKLALIDAYWNRTYVSEDTTWPAGTRQHRDLAVWVDLATGHYCAFTGDTSLGGPLGDGYMHQSPATRYPQPGGTP